MAHTTPAKLRDLKEILKEISSWDSIRERGAGIFYFRSVPFLHFHDKDGERWAHVKNEKKWKMLILPFEANNSSKTSFLKNVRKLYLQSLRLRGAVRQEHLARP